MCWEMDYQFFAEQKKARDAQIKQQQRAVVIDKLMHEANKQAENVKKTSAIEVAPAK